MAEEKNMEIAEPKPLTYLCRFDEDGRRGETRLGCEYTDEQKEAMIADGFVEILENDWNYYVGNRGAGDNGTGYIRDTKTGKPVSAPAHMPTTEEKLAQLNYQYAAEKSRLKDYWENADMMEDNETKEELREELQELEDWYAEEYEEIMGGEE